MDNLKDLLSTPTWYYPEFKEITGSVNAALILQRLLYWWDKKQGEFIYKTVRELKTEMALSRDMQLSAIKELERRKFIDVLYLGMPAKRHFKVNHDEIRKRLEKLFENHEMTDNQQMKDNPAQVGKDEGRMSEKPTSYNGKPDSKMTDSPASYNGKSCNNMSGKPTCNTSTTAISTASKTANSTSLCEKEFSQGSENRESDSDFLSKADDELNKKKNPPGSADPPLKKSLHSNMKVLFMEFFIENGGQPYYWTGKDGKHLKELIDKIEFLMKSENMVTTGDYIQEQFRFILENIRDEWILNNLSVSIINTKFNEIILKIKKHRDGQATGETECCTSEAFKREVYERLLGKQV